MYIGSSAICGATSTSCFPYVCKRFGGIYILDSDKLRGAEDNLGISPDSTSGCMTEGIISV